MRTGLHPLHFCICFVFVCIQLVVSNFRYPGVQDWDGVDRIVPLDHTNFEDFISNNVSVVVYSSPSDLAKDNPIPHVASGKNKLLLQVCLLSFMLCTYICHVFFPDRHDSLSSPLTV